MYTIVIIIGKHVLWCDNVLSPLFGRDYTPADVAAWHIVKFTTSDTLQVKANFKDCATKQ